MTTVIHVISGLARDHGGPSYSVPRLCQELAENSVNVQLVTVAQDDIELPSPAIGFAQDFNGAPLLSGQRLSGALHKFLVETAAEADIIHSHGLWLAPNLYAGFTARQSETPLIVSARGMLAEAALQYSKRKKMLYWSAIQGPAVRYAAGWHATSNIEANDIRAFGVETPPIAIIPNGVDVPTSGVEHDVLKSRRRVLFMSRIHKHKGLLNLLDAWAKTEHSAEGWELVIAGPDAENHQRELIQRSIDLGLARVEFRGPVFGSERDRLVASADLFVLPSRSENFGLVVAESLAAGLPVITTKGAPWADLHTHRCGWWIDHGVEPLAVALRDATSLPVYERAAMGARGRAWMKSEYSWSAIGAQMNQYYNWLLHKGDRPNNILGARRIQFGQTDHTPSKYF